MTIDTVVNFATIDDLHDFFIGITYFSTADPLVRF